jgi:hypothetical protein
MGNRESAVDFFNAGQRALHDRSQPSNLQHAYHLFSSTVLADPTYGLGWYWLGNANSDLNMLQAAIAAWRRGLRCDLDDRLRSQMLVNIGWTFHRIGNQVEAKKLLRDAIAIDPESSAAWMNVGVVERILGDSALALQCAATAYNLAYSKRTTNLPPDDPEIVRGELDSIYQMSLAFAHLFCGDYAEGLKHFEIRFKHRLHQFLHYPYPQWHGEPDKTVLLVADQGLGDTLSYARFVPAAAKRARYIHMVVQPELIRAFSQAFIDLVNINIIPLSSPFIPADGWTTFVSLPHALQLTDEEIKTTPQIKLPIYSLNTSWMVPNTKMHIAIAYAGSPLNDIDALRNIPPLQFLDLYRVPDIQLYSLQVGDRAKDSADVGCMGLIRDLGPFIRDVTDTVAILRDIDLVICCESALGHICASVGKECWIPYSYLGHDYRIGTNGENLLWAPKHRIFKQDSGMRWEPVFERIVEALKERMQQ